ncbi:MAG: hypothetical protein HUU41_10820 [Bryobacteraceae bacterium]|nr:hypothetical protein [Bryobacterales bacterium]NUN01599.1 hypothetical protein [Bryobacteraceae bacterium]
MLVPRRVPFWTLAAVTAAALVLAALLIWRVTVTSQGPLMGGADATLENRVAELTAENQELRQRLDSAEHELKTATQAAGRKARPTVPEPARDNELVLQLRSEIASANQIITGLQERVAELEQSVKNAAQENTQLAARQREIRDNLEASKRLVEALKTEVAGKAERLTDLERNYGKVRDDYRAAEDRVNRLLRLSRDLEDLNRRREVYVGNMLRRYRDVTDQYRALADRLDSGTGTAGASGELSRIQNSIQMAEEDLRQLSALNLEAAKLGKLLVR